MIIAAGCATTTASYRAGERAEQAKDYDRAVVEHTNALRANPDDYDSKLSLDRAKIARFGRAHRARAQVRRSERYEDALVEISWRASSTPTCHAQADLRDARRSCAPRTRLARRQDLLELLIERARSAAPPASSCRKGRSSPSRWCSAPRRAAPCSARSRSSPA